MKTFYTISILIFLISLANCQTVNQPDSTCISNFRAGILNAHNALRLQHNVQILKENKSIVDIAQNYSKYLAVNALFQHSQAANLGENLFVTYSTVQSIGNCTAFAQNCVQSWYDEVKSYNFSNPGFSGSTGHFTQVVWKGTSQLGCGISTGLKNFGINYFATYCVCNYVAPGNYLGQFAQNVLPKSSNNNTSTPSVSTIVSKISSSSTKTVPTATATTTKSQSGSTTTAAGKQPSSDCLAKFQSSVLKAHNTFRALHQVSSLVENKTITQIAQNYSKYLADNALFQHSQAANLGENLYVSYSTADPLANCTAFAQSCVQAWYDEVKSYNFSNPGFSGSTGHFTQVVWKGTSQLGCGVSTGSANFGIIYKAAYCVCNYAAPGNYLGQFAQNVFAKK